MSDAVDIDVRIRVDGVEWNYQDKVSVDEFFGRLPLWWPSIVAALRRKMKEKK